MKIFTRDNFQYAIGLFFLIVVMALLIFSLKEIRVESDIGKLVGKDIIISLEFDDSENKSKSLWKGKIEKIDDRMIKIVEVCKYVPTYRNKSLRRKYRRYRSESRDNLVNADN